MKTLQRSTEELIQPAEKVQDSVIYLLHPNRRMKFKLLRGGIEKTLRRFGYVEITKEKYEANE